MNTLHIYKESKTDDIILSALEFDIFQFFMSKDEDFCCRYVDLTVRFKKATPEDLNKAVQKLVHRNLLEKKYFIWTNENLYFIPVSLFRQKPILHNTGVVENE